MFERRLKLGKFLGIGLYVHWSLGLWIIYVAFMNRADGVFTMLFSVALLLGAFLCVTLHEYGHAMAARHFGIGTADITLLPIGGVARLNRMPRIPWQELVVAIAGPAVNVVLAILLLIGFWAFTDGSIFSVVSASVDSLASAELPDQEVNANAMEIAEPGWGTIFAVGMLIVNLMLVFFNMIPAFPMDGGRVFRSLLAMLMEYRLATRIASRIGLLCAAMMAFAALQLFDSPNWVLVLISAFIGYAGISEAKQVDVMETVRGLTVGQVMIQSTESIPMDMSIVEVADRWSAVRAESLPVLSLPGTVVGILRLRDVLDAMEKGVDSRTTAGELVDREQHIETMQIDEELESALMRVGRQFRQVPVVDPSGRLVGTVEIDSMLLRAKLSGFNGRRVEQQLESYFDQTT